MKSLRTRADVDRDLTAALDIFRLIFLSGEIVVVSQVRARRAHIKKPMDGWASLATESGYVIMEAIARPTKYKVRRAY